MFRVLSLLTVLVICLGSNPTQAQQEPLQPSQKWVADYAKNMCVLSRTYGTGKNSITLGLRHMPLSDFAEIILMQPNKGASKPRAGKLTITFPETGKTIETRYWSVYSQRAGKRIANADIELDRENLTRARSISLRYDAASPVTLALSETAAALRVLDHCAADLLKSWNMDPEFRKNIAQYAEPSSLSGDPADWITDADYPLPAIQMRVQGTSYILWRINTEGRVDECRIVQSSGNDLLDDAACDAIKRRGRYRVAFDKDGKPVVNYASRRVRWIMASD